MVEPGRHALLGDSTPWLRLCCYADSAILALLPIFGCFEFVFIVSRVNARLHSALFRIFIVTLLIDAKSDAFIKITLLCRVFGSISFRERVHAFVVGRVLCRAPVEIASWRVHIGLALFLIQFDVYLFFIFDELAYFNEPLLFLLYHDLQLVRPFFFYEIVYGCANGRVVGRLFTTIDSSSQARLPTNCRLTLFLSTCRFQDGLGFILLWTNGADASYNCE